MNDINIAINICTFNRNDQLLKNLEDLRNSRFFSDKNSTYYGHLSVFVSDNGSNLDEVSEEYFDIKRNPRGNVGGAGGFQYGLERIRASAKNFTHLVFMDDDVSFELKAFYVLFDFLSNASEEELLHPVAGRMLRLEEPDIQYTSAEIWNSGYIEHIGHNLSVSENQDSEDWCNCDGAEYGGWWLCCFPMTFAKENDIIPFFIHCDDVEYGLRCGQKPIILKDFQVWHQSFEFRQTALIQYYDMRNRLLVNEKYNLDNTPEKIYKFWFDRVTSFHNKKMYDFEYYTILGLKDFMKGMEWLYTFHPGEYHTELKKCQYSKAINKKLAKETFEVFYEKYGVDLTKIYLKSRLRNEIYYNLVDKRPEIAKRFHKAHDQGTKTAKLTSLFCLIFWNIGYCFIKEKE